MSSYISTPNTSQTQNLPQEIVNYDVQRFGNIKSLKSQKAQLQKVSKEFEAIFVTKMLSTMDKTVNREGGIFTNDDKYMDKFKSFIYDEIGRDIARNPRTSIGFAKQIYSQMERYLPNEEPAAETAESDGQTAVQAAAAEESKETKGINRVDREI